MDINGRTIIHSVNADKGRMAHVLRDCPGVKAVIQFPNGAYVIIPGLFNSRKHAMRAINKWIKDHSNE